jgi:hypothetical protein
MANFDGTQEFMAAHMDHSLSISILSTVDTRYITEIQRFNNGFLYAVEGEKDSEEYVEDQAAYLYCHTCQVEEEINLGEWIED